MTMPALTALRGLLAWWVVAFHGLPLAPFEADQSNTWLQSGALSVDVFFVLSGFVLYSAYPIILDRRRPYILREFLIARFARIYPAHFVMLCAFLALFIATHIVGLRMRTESDYRIPDLIRQFLLLNGSIYPSRITWNFPSWSVAAEAVAYLLAPLTFLAIGHMRIGGALVAAAVLFVLVAILSETRWLGEAGHSVPQVLLEFALGALLLRIVQAFRECLVPAAPYALVVLVVVLLGGVASAHHGIVVCAMICLIAFLSLRLHHHRGMAGRIETVFLYLGETSYAVYLCHALVLGIWGGAETRIDEALMRSPAFGAIILGVSIQGVASLLHHVIEDPARHWIRANLCARKPRVAPYESEAKAAAD